MILKYVVFIELYCSLDVLAIVPLFDEERMEGQNVTLNHKFACN